MTKRVVFVISLPVVQQRGGFVAIQIPKMSKQDNRQQPCLRLLEAEASKLLKQKYHPITTADS